MRTQLAHERGAIASVVCFLLVGCSALVDPDPRTLDPEPKVCSPGQIVSCLCDDGLPHSQRCNAGGGFAPCDCDDQSGAAGASDGQGGRGGSSGRGNGRDDG